MIHDARGGGVEVVKVENGYIVTVYRPQGDRFASGQNPGSLVAQSYPEQMVFTNLDATMGFVRAYLKDPRDNIREGMGSSTA